MGRKKKEVKKEFEEESEEEKPKGPLVSILIPAYNTEKYIYGAINSAVIQTPREHGDHCA